MLKVLVLCRREKMAGKGTLSGYESIACDVPKAQTGFIHSYPMNELLS